MINKFYYFDLLFSDLFVAAIEMRLIPNERFDYDGTKWSENNK